MHLTCTNMPVEKLEEALEKVRHCIAAHVHTVNTSNTTRQRPQACATSSRCVVTLPRVRLRSSRLRVALAVHWTWSSLSGALQLATCLGPSSVLEIPNSGATHWS